MKIKLPDFVIVDLYQNSLVVEKKHVEEKFYLGENKRNILFLVNDKDGIFINHESLTTLTKILEALKMSIKDVAIVNFFHHKKPFQILKEKLQPKFIFLFDVTLLQLQLPFTIPDYQVQQYDNCIFMSAPAATLSAKNDDVTKKEKRKLWDNLKKIFAA